MRPSSKTIRHMVVIAALAGGLYWLLSTGLPHPAGNPPGRQAARAAPVVVGSAAQSPSAAASAPGSAWHPCRSLDSAQFSACGGQPVLLKVDRMEPGAMELTYSLPAPRLVAGAMAAAGDGGWERVRLANAPSLGRVGAPVLPVVPVRLLVASGYEVERAEVVRGRPTTLPGAHCIVPRQPPVPAMPGVRAKSAPPDPAIYLSDEPYPALTHTVIGVQKKRGVSILILNLNPVAYHPVSGKVVWYETLQLKVRARPALPRAGGSLSYRPDPVCALTEGAENPEMLAAGGYVLQTGGAVPADGGVVPLGNLCRAGVTNQYVVVTSAAIANATTDVTVRDLVAHKQARGISAALVTIEDVLAGYPGVDDAEKLRNFIKDAYSLWGTDYVLLGGDANIIPMRKLWNRCLDEGSAWYEDNIPSDLYFQCLDGDFNSNGNDKWGEESDGPGGTDVDLLAEVYVGRAAAENETEMANFVYKTLAHENESRDADHLRTALMAGEYLGNYPNCYGDDQMEEIVQGSGLWGYATLGFVSNPRIRMTRLYDRQRTWTSVDMINALNSNTYGIVNHLGHASETYDLRLYNENVDALTNTHGFFAYSQGCDSGAFDTDCIAEHFTTSTRYGAYAVVFNSRYGFFYSQNTDGPSQHLHRAFWDEMFRHGIQNLGVLNAKSHEDNIWALGETEVRWCMYETNLLGDPETPLNVPRNASFVITIF